MAGSNDDLKSYLASCDEAEVASLILLLKSRFSPTSRELAERFGKQEAIPPAESEERHELAGRVVALLGWYGANAFAYAWRSGTSGDGAAPYSTPARDVAKLIRKRLDKKDRPPIPRVAAVQDLEELIVQMCLTAFFKNMSADELAQTFQEAGLERDVAEHAARSYGPGMAGLGLPVLVKILGKKTVTVMVEHMIVAIASKFIVKEAAKQMAKRIIVQVAQKTIARMVTVIGWLLVIGDVALFAAAPARRITIKAVPFIAACRVRQRLLDNQKFGTRVETGCIDQQEGSNGTTANRGDTPTRKQRNTDGTLRPGLADPK